MEQGERTRQREEKGRAGRPKGAPTPRQRGEGGGASGRPPQESRRKRNTEQRFTGYGDGIERAFCVRAERVLPSTFPVASHSGTATIPHTIVARREGAVLLCTHAHFGEHCWPDGETVTEPAGDAPA